MPAPLFVEYKSKEEYREHYERIYCTAPIITFDDMPVFFRKDRFYHCFFESSKRDGVKDVFSCKRAIRINWIKSTLENKDAKLYVGWDKKKKRLDLKYRVAVVYEDFVVIIRIGRKTDGLLKAEFITSYMADNSIDKIRSSPEWVLKI